MRCSPRSTEGRPPKSAVAARARSSISPGTRQAPRQARSSGSAELAGSRTAVGIHHVQDHGPVIPAEAAAARGIETSLRDFGALRRDTGLAGELEGIGEALTGALATEGVLGKAPREHGLHPVIAERKAIAGAFG